MRRGSRSAIFAHAASMWAQMHEDFLLALQAHMDAADEAARGELFSAEGRRAGVSVARLFACNQAAAARYASPELVEFWQSHPRPTLAEFEAAWFASTFASVA